MKNLILTFALILISVIAFSQKILEVPTTSATFKSIGKAGDLIVKTGTNPALYIVKTGKMVGTKHTILTAVSGSLIEALYYASASGYLDTTNAQTSHGAKGFFGAVTAYSTLDVTGATTLAGALSAAGAVGFGTSYNKFTVAAATGNTAIAGTLAVTGASTLTGATTIAGALNAAGAIGFGTSNNKVTIAAATGNTAIAGTLGVTGVATIQGQTMTATHVNVLTFGNSVAATDTIQGAIVKSTGKVLGTFVLPSTVDTTGLGIPTNRGIIIYNAASAKHYGYNGTWNALY